ncbi:MAG: hypothetical protein J6W14_05055, partial [Clostridia bacterium]|nr:hypothetical protein [Clostridia bacterium]
VAALVIRIVIVVLLGIVGTVAGWVVGLVPFVGGILAWAIGTVVDLYAVVGIVLSILNFCDVLK